MVGELIRKVCENKLYKTYFMIVNISVSKLSQGDILKRYNIGVFIEFDKNLGITYFENGVSKFKISQLQMPLNRNRKFRKIAKVATSDFMNVIKYFDINLFY